ncbi:MAG TPA: protein kinase, partial [Candidatus Desulfaltia sp.]|nr:protein kinase [Candidatus Desulfaltia sp.]
MSNKCPKCEFDNPEDTIYCGHCAAPLKPSTKDPFVLTETLRAPREELTTGSTFAGKYQIIEELGKGGMGRVYKALDTEVNEKVALKLIKPEVALDRETIERFRNELKLARKIRHKNVCQMFDLNTSEGIYYITMEYVSGQDLKGLIRQSGRLAVETAVSIAKQICDGLEEAHGLGIVHRDLKPGNIMVDRDGQARIMDFGIARSLKAKGITGAGVMIGTPEYMSPEQVEGKEVDARSDIYSLGVILYEMVAGRVPFEGDTPFTVGVKHKSEVPRPPKELNAQIPEDLNRVILKCLEKEKGKRYQSAGELRSDLSRIEEGMPTAARVIPKKTAFTSKQITVTVGVKKLVVPGVALIALVALALVLWRVIPKKKAAPIPTDKPSVAIMYFKNNTGDAALDHWRTMISNLLVTDLTQSKHIRVLSEDKLFQILTRLGQEDSQTYSADVLREVAAEGRVNHIIQGAYAKAGDEFRINVTLQAAGSGELIGSESVAGKGEGSIFSMVDELTRRVKANFKLSPQDIASDIDKDAGIVTTSSPDAYKYYVEGIRHDVKGEYRQEIESMEKAVAIDPEFASAYLAMSWSYQNLVYFAEQKKYAEKAMALSDRLTDREKYNIQGHYYGDSEKTYDKAVEALGKLVALYPDDISGNNMLAIVYSGMGENERAIARYKVCLAAGTEDVVIYRNLAGTYEYIGAYDKAIEVYESYLKNIGDSAVIRRSLADTYLLLGKNDLALFELDKAVALSPTDWENNRTRGDIYLYMDNLSGAEEEYTKLRQRNEMDGRGWGLERLIDLYPLQGRFGEAKKLARVFIEMAEKLGQSRWERLFRINLSYQERRSGHPEAALQELHKAWANAVADESFGDQRNILLDQGLAHLEMKSISQAQAVAARLKAAVDLAPNKKLIWYSHYLTGMIELEKKNYSKAVELFNLGLPLLNADSGTHFLFANAMGTAFNRLGDLDSARREYEKIASLGVSRLSYGDIYAKAYYQLGKISEQQGKTAEAAEHYRKFLSLWKDADPGRPEVEDAKKRLAAIG